MTTARSLPGRVAALVGLAALVAAGCSSPASEPAAPVADAVTIQHKYGSTVIDGRPTRVATVGATDHDAVLALGVTPVLVVDWRDSPYFPWNEGAVGTPRPAEIPDGSDGVDIEAVAAQAPDLIVSLWSDLSESDYRKLSRIAPTIAPSAEYPAYGMPWQDSTVTVGRALGRADEAERLVGEVSDGLRDLAARHPDLAGKSVVIAADFGDGNVYITPPTDSRYGLLTALGMRTDIPELAGTDTLSAEQVGVLDAADVVLWITLPGATVQDDPVYLSQSVHEQGRDVFLESDIGTALTFGTVLSLPYAGERLAPQLTAAADADAATPVPAAG